MPKELLYCCPSCPRVFFTKAACKDHSKIHTDEALVCTLCGKKKASKRAMKNHMLGIHQIGERKRLLCDQCPAIYLSSNSLARHKRYVHVNPAQFYECTYCGKKFKRSVSSHIRDF